MKSLYSHDTMKLNRQFKFSNLLNPDSKKYKQMSALHVHTVEEISKIHQVKQSEQQKTPSQQA